MLQAKLYGVAALLALSELTYAVAAHIVESGSAGSVFAARGGINVSQRGLAHVLERHAAGGARTAGKSIFNQGEDIAGLIRGAESIAPVQQAGGNFQRIVDAGRAIGIDRATG